MAVLIFKLRHVPDDEAHEVRELLCDNGIDFYETSVGILGISMPGLWLNHEEQLAKARPLIDEYQQLRQQKARQEYEQGNARSFLDMFKEAPLRYTSFILVIILLCYLTIFTFFNL